MYLDLQTGFPQKGPRSSHDTSSSVRKQEPRVNTVRICRKYPFNNTKGWHSIISLYSITAYILRCSKLPLTLLWVWTVSRSRLSPYCVLHILKKYFHNTEWFILHLLFFINQKGLSDRENFFTLYLRFWKIQTRFLCYENSARNRKH